MILKLGQCVLPTMRVRAFNRCGFALFPGAVVCFDEGLEDAATTSVLDGNSANPWGNVLSLTTVARAQNTCAIFERAKDGSATLADDAEGYFVVQGVCDALIKASDVKGKVLVPNIAAHASAATAAASTTYLSAIATGAIAAGCAKLLVTNGAAVALQRVLFNGLAWSGSNVCVS
jgi:hypothetical protein